MYPALTVLLQAQDSDKQTVEEEPPLESFYDTPTIPDYADGDLNTYGTPATPPITAKDVPLVTSSGVQCAVVCLARPVQGR